jgi:hypothetical protein
MKLATILVLSIATIAFAATFQTANAATITLTSLNKESYLAGQTGYVSATIYNDENSEIRVTELTCTINYFYTDGTTYVQKFFTNADMPISIQQGQSRILQIPISLPTNLASGYVNLIVQARTELWVTLTQRWISSDQPVSDVKLFVETPYKQSYEDSQAQLEQSQSDLQASNAQLLEQKSANQNLMYMAIGLGAATLVFVGIAAFLMLTLARRPRAVPQPPQ